jgi:hypothetical protein
LRFALPQAEPPAVSRTSSPKPVRKGDIARAMPEQKNPRGQTVEASDEDLAGCRPARIVRADPANFSVRTREESFR